MPGIHVTYCLHCLESWTWDLYDRQRAPAEWEMYLNDVLLDHLLENVRCMDGVREMVKLGKALATLATMGDLKDSA